MRTAELNGRADEELPDREQENVRDNQADIGEDRAEPQLEIELDGPELQQHGFAYSSYKQYE